MIIMLVAYKLCRMLLHFHPSLIQYDFIVADFFMLYKVDLTWILLQQWMIAGLRTYHGKLWYLPVEGCKVQSPQTYTSGLTRSVSHCAESGNQPLDIFPASSYTPVHPSRSYHDNIDLHYPTPQVSSSGVLLMICVKSIDCTCWKGDKY
jgi:hypothetical protein